MKYRISKIFHNEDYDVIEITDKKTLQKNTYAFPIQKNDAIVKLSVKVQSLNGQISETNK